MLKVELNAKEFEALFNEKYEQLYYFAFDYVEDGDIARDIVSDVFTAIWLSRERIVLTNINSYLYVSVKNRCLDYLRELRRLDTTERTLPDDLSDDTDWEERETEIRQLQEEIRHLPIKAQWMLKEKFFNGRSYKEMAEMLGITVDGVKKIVTRAYSQLRKRMTVKIE